MIDPKRTVALVGRPNVGKSRLFNCLAGRRLSIVHDQPGVTRDLIATEVDDDFILLDTGGIGMELKMTPKAISEAAEDQVDYALATSSLILLVVDAKEGCTALDEIVAERLRRFGKTVRVIVNKVDNPGEEAVAADFASLGLGDPICVSAEHGRGTGAIFDLVEEVFGPPQIQESSEAAVPRIRFSLVGRPNVGKSSIGNALLKSSRLIVSNVPGTTRDSVEMDLDFPRTDGHDWHFRLIDTAGLRVKGKVDSSVEFFSSVRTQDAVRKSDVVFLVVDAMDGVTRQDQSLAGDIIDQGKALVIVVNKWDLVKARFEEERPAGYDSLKAFLKDYEASLRKELFFLPDPPVLFVSAQTGYQLESMLSAAVEVESTLDMKLPTGPLNRCLERCFEERAPRVVETKRFKLFYSVQVGARPFRLKMFCNRVTRLDATYRRYLERTINQEFRLRGCPVRFELVGKERRYADPQVDSEPAPKWTKEMTRRKDLERKRADAPSRAAKAKTKAAKKPILSGNQRAKARQGGKSKRG